ALKRRYGRDRHNNGRIYLSQRKAAQELGSHHNEIARWFRELQHYGFIEMMKPGCLGLEGKGKAPHWRLTELGCLRDPPTREFMHWDGTFFSDRKIESRAGNGARRVPENRHTHVPEIHAPNDKSVPEIPHIREAECVPENQHISSIPLPPPTLLSSNV